MLCFHIGQSSYWGGGTIIDWVGGGYVVTLPPKTVGLTIVSNALRKAYSEAREVNDCIHIIISL